MNKKIVFIVVSVILVALILIYANIINSNNKSILAVNSLQKNPQKEREKINTCSANKEQTDQAKEAEVLGKSLDLDTSDALIMAWDNLEVNVSVNDKEKIGDFIKKLSIGGYKLTSEQEKNLFSILENLIFAFGKNDHNAYFQIMRKMGETPRKEVLDAFKEILIKRGMSETEIAKDSWTILSQFGKVCKYNSNWEGLALKGSSINLFTAGIPAEQLKVPGEFFKETLSSIRNINHLTQPPSSFNEVLKSKGSILLADATIMVSFNEQDGGKKRPYVIRFWYDSTTKQWRPLKMTFFKSRSESLKSRIMF